MHTCRLIRCSLILALAALALPGLARGASRVLVVPFAIHAAEDLSFLQKGISAMLATRLADGDKVAVLGPGEAEAALAGLAGALTAAQARVAGEKAKADYVAFGSLTVFGDSISTDARFLAVADGAERVVFSDTGRSQGDVIAHVNRFAGQVNFQVFGRQTADWQPGAAAAGGPPPAPQAAGAPPAGEDRTRRNPEKLWAGETGMQLATDDDDTSDEGAALWRSRRYGFQVVGLTLGDVDGDGQVETVFAGRYQVHVYRKKGEAFEKVAEFEVERGKNLLALDAMDADGNGRDEIFLTCRTDDYVIASYVVEWDGTKFAKVQDMPGWFLRVAANPKTGRRTLYGQRTGMEELFGYPAYTLARVGGEYVPQGPVALPRGATVFGFVHADVTGDGAEDFVTLSRDDYLQLYDAAGREEWTSGERFGGKYDYLMTNQEFVYHNRLSRTDPDPVPDNPYFIPQRVLLTDFDRDGKSEVFVVQNDDATGRLLTRVRAFRQGRFEALRWDNVGLTTVWRTRNFAGLISDYYVGDVDNDGADELVFAVVKTVGDPVTGDAKTYLVAWKPQIGKKDSPK